MRGILVRRADITADDERAMYALLQDQFLGVSRAQFREDLDGKNWLVLLRSITDDRLHGFSTIHFGRHEFKGRAISVVYSGDTVVAPDRAMGSVLSRTWIGAVIHLHRQTQCTKMYWLLLTSGYRSYRFLPVYWQAFYPRYDVPTPTEFRRLMDSLAVGRFGAQYLREVGVVRFPRPQILQPPFRGIPAHRMEDAHSLLRPRQPGTRARR